MIIGGLQKVSLTDYPGKISAVVFTQGCNFRCPYCHNPELVDPEQYRECIPENELFSYLEKRSGKIQAVTITGGEPTLQKDLRSFIGKIRDGGFLIKLDTNGSNPDIIRELIDQRLIDYIAMDIKAPLKKYTHVTRTDAKKEVIKQSIEIIKEAKIDREFRTTVVKSQLEAADILAIGTIIGGVPLYALQRFVPTKTLDKDFLYKCTLNEAELQVVKSKLSRKIGRIVIR